MRQKWTMFIWVVVLLIIPKSGLAVEGYSNRCDWCVAAGFWENVIRGNDRCLDYVSAEIRDEMAQMSKVFRTKMIKKCGPKYHDGHIESTFSYQRLGLLPDGTAKVRVYGAATTTCKGKQPFLKEDFVVTTRPKKENNRLWEVIHINYHLQ